MCLRGSFSAGSVIAFSFLASNPSAAQAALSNVSCALTRSDGIELASSVSGTFPAIVDGSLGSGAPVVSLSNVIKGATGVTMTLTFTPAFVVPSNGRLIVTLSGAGLGCAAGAAVSFVAPAEGLVFHRVKVELFLSVGGGSVSDLKASSKYKANSPDRVYYFPSIWLGWDGGNPYEHQRNDFQYYPWSKGMAGDVRDNYGARFTATLCPTVSGVYQLSLAADNAAELSIGREDEATKTVIGPSGSSLLQYGFDAGFRYNVEVLLKEQSGADHVSLSWKAPGAASLVDVPAAAYCLATASISSAQVLTVTLHSFAPFPADSAITLTFGSVTNPLLRSLR